MKHEPPTRSGTKNRGEQRSPRSSDDADQFFFAQQGFVQPAGHAVLVAQQALAAPGAPPAQQVAGLVAQLLSVKAAAVMEARVRMRFILVGLRCSGLNSCWESIVRWQRVGIIPNNFAVPGFRAGGFDKSARLHYRGTHDNPIHPLLPSPFVRTFAFWLQCRRSGVH